MGDWDETSGKPTRAFPTRKRRDDDPAGRQPAGSGPAWRGGAAHGQWHGEPARSPREPSSIVDPARIGTGPRRRSGALPAQDWLRLARALPGALPARLADAPERANCARRLAVPMGPGWLHEIAWEGYRLLAHVDGASVRLVNRRGDDWTAGFPAITDALARLSVGESWFDGELVALDARGRSDCRRLQDAMESGETGTLSYVLFDLPSLAGTDLRKVPLIARKRLLHSVLAANRSPVLAYGSHVVGHGERVFEASRMQRVAGIVSKRIDSDYAPARPSPWVKVTHDRVDEFVVVGKVDAGKARRRELLLARADGGRLVCAGTALQGPVGSRALVCAPPRKSSAGDSGGDAGLTVPAAQALPADARISWLRPGLVVEVAHRGMDSDGWLHDPVIRRVRDDKSPQDLQSEPPMEGRISHPERIVYPSAKLTKGQVAEYYRAVAPHMLRELANRPLSLLRCPGGVEEGCFFQKHYLASFGDRVGRIRLRQKDGEHDYFYVEDMDGLMALVQMNAIEFHPWGSRIDAPECPDRLVFDLDPGEGVSWKQLQGAAREVRDRLEDAGLHSFLRLTGGKGVHVVAPISRGPDWDRVGAFSEAFAHSMVESNPALYVATMSKARRAGRIFIDWLRNTRGATSIASWSLRARKGAPVSVPLRWEELARIRSADQFDLHKAMRRAAGLASDPWQELATTIQSLPEDRDWSAGRSVS